VLPFAIVFTITALIHFGIPGWRNRHGK
jgi:hypothetical protein